MEQEQAQHKKGNVIVYVVIGVAVLLVIVLLAGKSGSGGGSVTSVSPQAVAAADQSAAQTQIATQQTVLGKAQTAAEMKVALAQARSQLELGLAETKASTEQSRISAGSQDQIARTEYGTNTQKLNMQRIIAAVMSNLNFSGASPVQFYPSGAAMMSPGGSVYGVPTIGTVSPGYAAGMAYGPGYSVGMSGGGSGLWAAFQAWLSQQGYAGGPYSGTGYVPSGAYA